MPAPTLTFGFIIATLFGVAFHLFLGGDVRRMASFLIAGWLGFLLGHLAGGFLEFQFLNVGALHMLPASFGAFIALIFTQALTSRRLGGRSSR